MINHVILLFALFAVWSVLSGFFGGFFIGLGLISCLLSLYFVIRMTKGEKQESISYVVKFPVYFIWLLKEITMSTLDVTKRVWQIKPRISPLIGWVDSAQDNPVGSTIFANSITLTPGTVSIKIESKRILVHALSRAAFKELKQGKMDSKVASLDRKGDVA